MRQLKIRLKFNIIELEDDENKEDAIVNFLVGLTQIYEDYLEFKEV